jgi:hypothetical protein
MTAPRAGVVGIAALALALAAPGASAAHPMITEDPGTLGAGRVELELGFSATRGDPAAGRYGSFSPQLSVGATPVLDLIVQPRYVAQPAANDGASGWTDIALDAKWRFLGRENVQAAVRFGVDVPGQGTAPSARSSGAGFRATLAVSVPVGEASAIANVGYARARTPGERVSRPYASAAWLAPAQGALRGFVEAAAQANASPGRSTWPAVARAGVLWAATPGLDLDAGIEGRLNHAAPAATLLVGATLRW